jgi:hypothetical protein
VTILTLFALFGDDINTCAFDKSSDYTFDILQLVVMGIFFVEAVLSSIAINGYLFSFFFWLDLLSTVTILMDVNMFTDVIFSTDSSSQTGTISKLASQSKTSRAAARAVRIIRLIRLLRVVKLYKSAVKANEIKDNIKRQRLKNKISKASSEKVQTRVQVTQPGTCENVEAIEFVQEPRIDNKGNSEVIQADAAIV